MTVGWKQFGECGIFVNRVGGPVASVDLLYVCLIMAVSRYMTGDFINPLDTGVMTYMAALIRTKRRVSMHK